MVALPLGKGTYLFADSSLNPQAISLTNDAAFDSPARGVVFAAIDLPGR